MQNQAEICKEKKTNFNSANLYQNIALICKYMNPKYGKIESIESIYI